MMHQPGGLQHHHQQLGQPLVIQLPPGVDGSQATAYVLDAAGNVTLSNAGGNILTVDGHLVQGHAQVQEVHLTDERGNVQQVTYATAYTNPQGTVTLTDASGLANVVVETGNQTSTTVVSNDDYTTVMQAIEDDGVVSLSQGDSNSLEIDSSYHYYDNLRGKINSRILTELVNKYEAENPNLSKNDRLSQWSLVTSEYQQMTGQTNKTRTALMKRWSSARYYREHEGRPVDQGGRVKGCFVKKPGTESVNGAELKSSALERNLKEYEILQLEAARLERDAQKVHMDNALIEQEKLRKEANLAAIELNTAKLELAMKQEEARKMGLVIQFEATEDDVEEMIDQEQLNNT